ERASVATAYRQGCAAIRLEGSRDADHPQLEVRAGVDATRLVLAVDPPETGFVHAGELALPPGDLLHSPSSLATTPSAVTGRGPRSIRWIAAFGGLGTVAVGSVIAIAVTRGGGSTPRSSDAGAPVSARATTLGGA